MGEAHLLEGVGGEGQKDFPQERVPELGLAKSAKGVGKCVAGTGRSMRGGTEARTWDEATELPFKGGGMVRRPVRGRSGRPLGATLRTLD